MIQATKLQVNRLTNPMGVGFQCPCFSWQPARALRQSAYEITAVCKEMILLSTGKICSDETMFQWNITLPSRAHVTWSVLLWDENDVPGELASGWFERGPDSRDWKAKWIDPEPEETETRKPASYLKKTFCVAKASHARLYMTAHGIYNAYLNGIPIEGYCLAPGSSQYDKRLQVQTYDVTPHVQNGENELIVTLGDGWYRGSTHNDMELNTFGTDVALLCQLEVDGAVVAVSDESWQASQSGPLGLNDLMMGETYDARKWPISVWHAVTPKHYGYDNLVGTDTVAVTEHETFTAKRLQTPSGETVLDFGQNIAGYVKFSVQASEGQTLVLTHGETLDENGNFTIQNFQNQRHPQCFQRITYTCKQGENVYAPTKCYFGFRYVKLEGDLAAQVTGEEFTAVCLYSDMAQTGWFTCGDARVNRLVENALWSMKGNFVDVPTDCPTREKSGYSGDLVTFCHTAMYLMDCWPVLTRWLHEQAATQFEDGCVRQVAPNGRARGYWDGGAGWCDSMELVPWRLMRRYNDASVLRPLYPAMRKWMLFCLERAKTTREENSDIPAELQSYFADQGMHWGEWLEPDTDMRALMTQIGRHGEPEVATAFLSYGCNAMCEIAKALGESADEQFFANAAAQARAAYRYRFIKNGEIEQTHRQCLYVRPLSMQLLEPQETTAAAKALCANIKAHGNHLNTGFLSTHELCRVLTDSGYVQTAYDLLLQPNYPGWLYPVERGATTIWENWKGIAEDGTVRDSHNHYSFGAVVGWLFDRACGIVVENGTILIKPYPDKRLGHARAVYHSPLGEIASAWEYVEKGIEFTVQIPCNSTAHVVLPDGAEHVVPAGRHSYFINKS